MPAGRPRTVSLPPDEMIKLGEDMIEWVKQNDPLHLSAWYSIEKNITDREWEMYQCCPEFSPYYEKALKMIGQKYLNKDSNVREGASQRWQRVYFKDLRKQEDEDLKNKVELEIYKQQKISEYEASLNAKSTLPPNETLLILQDEIIRKNARIRELEDAIKPQTRN